MRQVFRSNIANIPQLKWQYFGTEHGTHLVYPGNMQDDCDKFDPRYRFPIQICALLSHVHVHVSDSEEALTAFIQQKRGSKFTIMKSDRRVIKPAGEADTFIVELHRECKHST